MVKTFKIVKNVSSKLLIKKNTPTIQNNRPGLERKFNKSNTCLITMEPMKIIKIHNMRMKMMLKVKFQIKLPLILKSMRKRLMKRDLVLRNSILNKSNSIELILKVSVTIQQEI